LLALFWPLLVCVLFIYMNNRQCSISVCLKGRNQSNVNKSSIDNLFTANNLIYGLYLSVIGLITGLVVIKLTV